MPAIRAVRALQELGADLAKAPAPGADAVAIGSAALIAVTWPAARELPAGDDHGGPDPRPRLRQPEDLVALTIESAAMARVPLAGTNRIPGEGL